MYNIYKYHTWTLSKHQSSLIPIFFVINRHFAYFVIFRDVSRLWSNHDVTLNRVIEVSLVPLFC